MSGIQCGKEIVCLVAESADACSKYGEFMTPEEMDKCKEDAKRYKRFRIELAKRADNARAEET